MRNLTFSIMIGGVLAFFFAGVVFAAFSLFRPGWLRQVAGAKPTPISVQTLVAIVAAGGQVPNVTPIPTGVGTQAPTAVPLPTTAGACGGPQQMTIALLGMDTRGDQSSFRARTDAITLLNINFAAQTAAMLSVPRDLYVPLPNLGAVGIDQDRINTAFLFGEIYGVPGGGPAEFKQAIEDAWAKTRWGYDQTAIVPMTSDGWVRYISKLDQKPQYDLAIDWPNIRNT